MKDKDRGTAPEKWMRSVILDSTKKKMLIKGIIGIIDGNEQQTKVLHKC